MEFIIQYIWREPLGEAGVYEVINSMNNNSQEELFISRLHF